MVRAGIVAGLLTIFCCAGTKASAAGQVPCTLPLPPTALTAKVSGTLAVVSWNAPSGKRLGFVLEVGSATGTSNVLVVKLGAAAVSYSNTAPAGTYFVRLRTRNACGLGPASADITVSSPAYQNHPEVLVTARTAERNTYFPSVAKTHDGRLLVAYYDSPEHVSRQGRISAVESRDNGQTWSPPRVILDTPLDDRDPSLTVTRAGRLLLSYFARDYDSSKGRVFVARSGDDGTTWSEPVRVESMLDDVATSSKIVEADNGDLLIPLYGSIGDGVNSQVTIARSADGGRTWPRAQEIAVAAAADTNFSEPALAVADQRLLVLMRTDGFARETRSSDGGRSWSPPASIGMAAQSSELDLMPGQPALTAVHLWADWSHRWGDSRPTVAQTIRWRAADAIPAFGEPTVLYNSNCDDAGYPSGVVLDDGRLFIVFYDACLGYIGGAYLTPSTLRD
jgi:hypothetical protein